MSTTAERDGIRGKQFLGLTQAQCDSFVDNLKEYFEGEDSLQFSIQRDHVRARRADGAPLQSWDLDAAKIHVKSVLWTLENGQLVARQKKSLSSSATKLFEKPTFVDWLVPERLERRVISLFAGPQGCLKSAALLDLEMRAAIDGACIYKLSGEGEDIDRRMRAWLIRHSPKTKIEDLNIHVVTRRLDLTTDEHMALLMDDIESLDESPDLISIDTLSKYVSADFNENMSSDIRRFFRQLDRLKTKYEAAIVLVAHTGLGDQKRVRGSSAITADSDAAHIFSYDPRTKVVQMTRSRFKASPSLPPLSWRVEEIALGYRDPKGVEVKSITLVPVDSPSISQRPRDLKLPSNQRGLLQLIKAESFLTGDVDVVAIIDKAITANPSKGRSTPAQRRAAFEKALEGLIAAGHVVSTTEDRVAPSTET